MQLLWAENIDTDNFAFHEELVKPNDKFGIGLWDLIISNGRAFAIKKPIPVPGGPIQHQSVDEYMDRKSRLTLLNVVFSLCQTKEQLIVEHLRFGFTYDVNDYGVSYLYSERKKDVIKSDCNYLFQKFLSKLPEENPVEKEPEEAPKTLLTMFKRGGFRKSEEDEWKTRRRMSAEF